MQAPSTKGLQQSLFDILNNFQILYFIKSKNHPHASLHFPEIQFSYNISGIKSNFLIINLELNINVVIFAKKIYNMISRTIEKIILPFLGTHKAIVIVGARQVGKSTLLNTLFKGKTETLWLNGDDNDTQQLFADITSTRLKALLAGVHTLLIDEAQRIPDVGMKIKLIVDNIPDIQVVATGSSAFELTSKINEPLTGRKIEYQMFPLTFKEMAENSNLLEELRMIPHRMVYGYYPEIVCNPGKETLLLQEISNSYLYKDILSLDSIHKPDKLVRLMKAIALQIGSQVSYNELSQIVGIDIKTIDKYIDVLEKAYVVFRLGSFARNLRNELKASRKIYFWDLGIRNALIGNFNQIENRDDVGALWENYVISERMKRNRYEFSYAQSWFWRTQQQQEIDYIEDKDGSINAYEIKWNANKGKTKPPQSFINSYTNAEFHVITPENIEQFLM